MSAAIHRIDLGQLAEDVELQEPTEGEREDCASNETANGESSSPESSTVDSMTSATTSNDDFEVRQSAWLLERANEDFDLDRAIAKEEQDRLEAELEVYESEQKVFWNERSSKHYPACSGSDLWNEPDISVKEYILGWFLRES